LGDTLSMSDIDRVWQFWLEPKPLSEADLQVRGRLWFGGGPEVDAQIQAEFGALVERARAGELMDWAKTPRGRLALIILIDQFPRNIHRGSPEAFAKDGLALALARDGFSDGSFDGLDSIERLFALLPFSHAEDLELQRRALWHAQQAALDARPEWKGMMRGSVDFARKHLDVIARFGRFPHRNATLGRVSSGEEQQYLEYLRATGQWL
jgi:uncharacterized protein (DUF924 family)